MKELAVHSLMDNALIKGAQVFTMSLGYGYRLGYTRCPEPTQRAVDRLAARNIMVVNSAGNGAVTLEEYFIPLPKLCDKVAVIAASEANGQRACFSNYGSHIDLTAPGTGHNLYCSEGTSFAAPRVAGVLAQLLSIDGGLSRAKQYQILTHTAVKNEDVCSSEGCAAGILNAGAATDMLRNMISEDASSNGYYSTFFLQLKEQADITETYAENIWLPANQSLLIEFAENTPHNLNLRATRLDVPVGPLSTTPVDLLNSFQQTGQNHCSGNFCYIENSEDEGRTYQVSLWNPDAANEFQESGRSLVPPPYYQVQISILGISDYLNKRTPLTPASVYSKGGLAWAKWRRDKIVSGVELAAKVRPQQSPDTLSVSSPVSGEPDLTFCLTQIDSQYWLGKSKATSQWVEYHSPEQMPGLVSKKQRCQIGGNPRLLTGKYDTLLSLSKQQAELKLIRVNEATDNEEFSVLLKNGVGFVVNNQLQPFCIFKQSGQSNFTVGIIKGSERLCQYKTIIEEQPGVFQTHNVSEFYMVAQ